MRFRTIRRVERLAFRSKDTGQDSPLSSSGRKRRQKPTGPTPEDIERHRKSYEEQKRVAS